MPQRDLESKIVVRTAQTLTMDSTGDDDLPVGIDTKGARGGMFAVTPAEALTTQETYLEILESDTLSGTYAPVAEGDEDAKNKQLPTELNVEYETDAAWGQLLVNANTGYQQQIGFFGTKRFVKLRAHTDTSQGSVALTVVPILHLAEKPTAQVWNPNVDGGDALP